MNDGTSIDPEKLAGKLAGQLAAADQAIADIPLEAKSWRLIDAESAPSSRASSASSASASGFVSDSRSTFRPTTQADVTEVQLIRRATPLVEAFGGRLPLPSELQDINEHFGVEVAQTVFSRAVETSAVYGPFVRRVRSFDPRNFGSVRESAATFEVTIVRSGLPLVEWGAVAETWRAWARSLGFTTDIIDTLEDNDLRANARLISSYLISNPHPRRILVTFGQGAAEFRTLMSMRLGLRGAASVDDAHELSCVHTWINVAGAYSGAAYARRVNESRWEKLKLEVSRYFGPMSVRARASRWLGLDPRLPAWRLAPNFPVGMQVINLVGLPYKTDMPSSLIVAHMELSISSGPNDGAVGVFEAIAHPGMIVPVAGMTAYAPAFRVEPVLKRVLAIIAEDAAVSTGVDSGGDEVDGVRSDDLRSSSSSPFPRDELELL